MTIDLKTRWAALRLDLKKHLGVGALIALVVTVAVAIAAARVPWWPATLMGLAHPLFAALLGLAAGAAAGWAKEYVVDTRTEGATVDRDDFLYTARGAVLGAVAGALVLMLVG